MADTLVPGKIYILKDIHVHYPANAEYTTLNTLTVVAKFVRYADEDFKHESQRLLNELLVDDMYLTDQGQLRTYNELGPAAARRLVPGLRGYDTFMDRYPFDHPRYPYNRHDGLYHMRYKTGLFQVVDILRNTPATTGYRNAVYDEKHERKTRQLRMWVILNDRVQIRPKVDTVKMLQQKATQTYLTRKGTRPALPSDLVEREIDAYLGGRPTRKRTRHHKK